MYGSMNIKAIGIVVRYVDWLLPLLLSLSVSDRPVHGCAPDGHLPRVTIPEAAASQRNARLYQLLYIYTVGPPDDEQQACSKHVGDCY
jgi:hypothetical protein